MKIPNSKTPLEEIESCEKDSIFWRLFDDTKVQTENNP